MCLVDRNAMSRTKISGNSLTVSTLVRRELLLRRIDLYKSIGLLLLACEIEISGFFSGDFC